MTAPTHAAARALAACALATCMHACTPDPPAWSTPVTGLAPIALSVWGPSPSDLWVVGGTCDFAKDCAPATQRSLVLHFDGRAWTRMDPGTQAVLWWVFGFGAGNVWLCGAQGTIIHYDGKTFTAVPSGAAADDTLFGIWGASPSDLWAAGGHADKASTVVRYDGKSWSRVADAPPVGDAMIAGTWFKVWGSASDDVYLVGQRGTLVHYNGSTFTKVDVTALGVTPRQGLFTAAGRAKNDVYVVGGDPARGVALHFDGQAWARVPGLDLSLAQQLTGVHESAAGDVAITGLAGAKFVGRGSTWRDDSTLAPDADLHAVWLDAPDDVFAAGGNYFLLKDGVVAHYGHAVATTVK